MDATAVVFAAPREVELRTVTMSEPGPEEVLVDTTVSGISPGTERLVYRGNAPAEEPADTTIDGLDGSLSFPLQYGYATVGTVERTGADVDDDLDGETVFAFHPHQDRLCVPIDDVVRLPADLDPEVAAMLPSVETATNFLLDGGPLVGERVTVFGAGVVGLCTVRLLSSLSLSSLAVVEPIERRRSLAAEFGADTAVAPSAVDDLYPDCDGPDLVYELSGNPEALDDAIGVAGRDTRVVVGSWYGTKRAALDLGGSFHRDRVSIESSQVSTIAASLSGRWSAARRRDVALERLRAAAPELRRLITDRLPVTDAQRAYTRLDETPADTLQTIFTY